MRKDGNDMRNRCTVMYGGNNDSDAKNLEECYRFKLPTQFRLNMLAIHKRRMLSKECSAR